MPAIYSPLPLLNRLLEIVRDDVAKKGHDIQSFQRLKELLKGGSERTYYLGECVVCHCTVRVICSAHEYSKRGTAFGQVCKPG